MNALKETDSWVRPLRSPAEWGQPRWMPAHVTIDVAGLSHQGHVRTSNEDHFLVSRFGRFLENVQSNVPADQIPARHELIGHALLVADGLGGHAAGEVASRAAISILFNLAVDTPDWIFRLDEQSLAAEVEGRAEERMEEISQLMTDQADANPGLHGFGTTLTVAFGLGEKWILAHVGDSRAYRFRRGALKQLSHDHTVAQELADTGIIGQQQVAFHPLRHQLTRLLGDDVRCPAPQIEPFVVEDGDRLLLCSDGLSDMLSDEKIAGILSVEQSAADCCRSLIDFALAAGGRDNVTAIVARLGLTPR